MEGTLGIKRRVGASVGQWIITAVASESPGKLFSEDTGLRSIQTHSSRILGGGVIDLLSFNKYSLSPSSALCGVAPDLHVETLITNMMEFGNETLGDN